MWICPVDVDGSVNIFELCRGDIVDAEVNNELDEPGFVPGVVVSGFEP